MIVPGTAIDLVCHVVTLADGKDKTSGDIYAYIRRSSGGGAANDKWWNASSESWSSSIPTGGDRPAAEHTAQGMWSYSLSGTATGALAAGETIDCRMTDNATESSATVTSDICSHTCDILANTVNAAVSGVSSQVTTVDTKVSNIGSGTGAALNFGSNTDSGVTDPLNGVSKVGTATGAYTDTYFDNASRQVITHATNNIDWVYRFNVGGGRNASKLTFNGYLNATAPASGKTINVQAYDFDGAAWDTIGVITGSGTTDETHDYTLLSRNTGTGANAGLVYIRFTATSQAGAVLGIDQLTIQAQNLGQTVGYTDGAVWVKASGTSGTTTYVNGTADNPCPIADAVTIASALGLTRFRIVNGETVTLPAGTWTSRSLIGDNWTLALNGQDVSGSYVEGAEVSGTTANTAQVEYYHCHINAGASLGPSKFLDCGFAGTVGSPVTTSGTGEFLFVDCFSEVAGMNAPYFTLANASGFNFRRWSGGSNITLNNASATLTMEVVTGGGQTIATAGASVELRGVCRAVTLTGIASGATCQINAVTGPISLAGADGTVNIYGVCGVVTDSRTGSPTLTNKAVSQATVNSAVWGPTVDATLKSLTIDNNAGVGLVVNGSTYAVNMDGASGVAELTSAAGTGVVITSASNSLDIGGKLDTTTVAQLVDGVWDEATASHVGAGTTGEAIGNAGAGASAADIADAVWEEAIADHSGTSGSTAEALSLATLDVPGVGETALNHDFGGADALAYKDGGTPIAGATIRVYTAAQWAAGSLGSPSGITNTDNNGRWLAPVYVPAGDYVIHFELPYQYGPDTETVTVP